jgi:hypothetical protein
VADDIHGLVQDPHDPNDIGADRVEDVVFTDRDTAKAPPDIWTRLPQFWIVAETVQRAIP